VFFIDDDDDTLESMWILADQTFLTCSKGMELGPVRDLAVGVVDPAMCLGSKLKIEQRTISAVFFKTGFLARGFWANAMNFYIDGYSQCHKNKLYDFSKNVFLRIKM
jgi:hypothetical protein